MLLFLMTSQVSSFWYTSSEEHGGLILCKTFICDISLLFFKPLICYRHCLITAPFGADNALHSYSVQTLLSAPQVLVPQALVLLRPT